MKILFINRSKESGPSMRRVFQPIIGRLSNGNIIDSIYLPDKRAGILSLGRNILFVIRYLKKNRNYDIVHVSGEVNYILFFIRAFRSVITVHDLVFLSKHVNLLKKRLYYLLWIYPLKYADAITFISEKSAKETNDIIDISKIKQYVIPNPVDSNYYFFNAKQPNRLCPVILHIGTKDNKNLERVIKAVSPLSCTLVIIGSLNSSQKLLLESEGVSFILKTNLSDAEILKEYINCDLVSFPSTYEGFGMPIIEGQAIGRPVVTSNLPPMDAIAGKGAVLVDPFCVESIRNGFLYALDNYEDIVSAGIINISKYKIEKVVDLYQRVYAELVK